MADEADVPVEDENYDSWLYGDSNDVNNAEERDKQGEGGAPGDKDAPPGDEKQDEDNENEGEETEDLGHNLTGHLDDEHFEDQLDGDDQENPDDVFGGGQNGEGQQQQQENGDSDSDDSEDDVKVIVGDNKSQPTQAYTNLNIKRGNLIAQPNLEKQKQTGKFTAEDFESVGNINGVPAQEFNIDVLEDKPWRKPGADITDYFNYGFTEDTWRAYCERQKRMRVHESGTGLIPLGGKDLSSGGVNTQQLRQLTPISNEHSTKYAPPPIINNNRKSGSIDVLSRRDGEENMSEPPPPMSPMGLPPPISHNTIQVMTADRRGYSRGKPFPDMSLPPPNPDDFFHQPPEQPPFYPPYEEPWGGPEQGGWAPGDIKELTPGPMHMGPPPGLVPPPGMVHPPMNMGPPPGMGHPGMMLRPPMSQPPHMGPGPNMPPYGPPPGHMEHMRERDRERDREREHRERERDRERELRDRERDREREHRERERDRDRDRDMEPEDKDLRESSEMRDRDRERSRSIKPDRHREKSHRRERSRSRSRRHKSRSRSPSSRHRSKKKSHHKDKDDSD